MDAGRGTSETSTLLPHGRKTQEQIRHQQATAVQARNSKEIITQQVYFSTLHPNYY
jgi:hypothetical protein